MKKIELKSISTCAAMFLAICVGPVRAADATPAPDHPIKIVLVGDSTVTDHAGLGLEFKQCLVPGKFELINTAQGGRRSLSFMRESRWTNAPALHGNYYLIQFGHNSEAGKPGRSTDMATLVANIKQYVDDTRAIGTMPVLVTPLTRRQWDKEHLGKIKSSLAPCAEEVRKIGIEKTVTVAADGSGNFKNIPAAMEYGGNKSHAECIDFSKRAPWAKMLTVREAVRCSGANVLGGWNPATALAHGHL